MPDDSYKTIKTNSEGFFKDKQSKFYSFAYHVNDEEEIKEIQKSLRKKFHDAKHHVYAFVIGENCEIYRYSDDGEPSNSSGPPIYNTIKSFELTNILVVVVRYFGGKKLGIPGLINAYKSATEDAINNAQIIEKTSDVTLELTFAYSLMNKVMYIFDKTGANILEQTFTTDCKIIANIRKGKKDELVEKLNKNGVNIKIYSKK
ncbi:MAG: YigZ family protein [Bacteroidales bacterium]|nr:YigZ family protein [Bacteroidales bacterium]